MEKVYKLTIELESTDEGDLAEILSRLADEVSEGLDGPGTKVTTSDNVESRVTYDISERCEDCKGEGEVSVDERDPDSGQMMRGVSVQRCHCQEDRDQGSLL